MLEYREIQDDMLEEFAAFNVDMADLLFLEREQIIRDVAEDFKRSRCIGIYEGERLIGSIVMLLEPPFQLLHLIPKENAEDFYARENVTEEDCVQMYYAIFPERTVQERLEFYAQVLKEMIAPGKEHILIFYNDDKHNRHRLYRRLKPEIIAQKEYPGFTRRLVFARRSHLLKELHRVGNLLRERHATTYAELQPF
jgi:hypothetical protein